MTNKPEIIVILNNIRSGENVGSIFRTCDAIGVSKIILCGYTPAPIDRFGRENKKLLKSSLGAEKFVPWERAENFGATVADLKNQKNSFPDFLVVGVEQSKNSIDYRKVKQLAACSKHLVLVFGNEVDGLSQDDLNLCDMVAEIPIRGLTVKHDNHPKRGKSGKESLNVAVAAGIVLYSLAGDW